MPWTPSPSDLVLAAKEALGTNTNADFAFELRRRYGLRITQSQISRWVAGDQGPNFATTIVLLRASGWLSPGGQSQSSATDQAEETIRRINAGEPIARQTLEGIADELLTIAQHDLRLVGELRRFAQAADEST